MCGFSVELVDFDKLSAKQKKDLLENYKKKKQAMQAHLKDANATLRGLTKAVKLIQSKSKTKSKSKSKSKRR
jgi:hypothetical protein